MHADPGCDFTNDQVEEYTVHDLWVMGLLHVLLSFNCHNLLVDILSMVTSILCFSNYAAAQFGSA